MKLAVNVILLLVIGLLGFILYSSIREPINFKSELDSRVGAVKDKLINIRKAQEAYRDITGEFAPSFDALKKTLTEDDFALVSITSDPNDPDNEDKYIYDTTFVSAFDSIKALGIELNGMEIVPFTEGKEQFKVYADTITYQKTLVHVCEVMTSYDKFMGSFADEKYTKYDDGYNPNAIIKFGSRSAPNLAGNW